MRAAIFTQYGPPEVLSIQTVARPEPKGTLILPAAMIKEALQGSWASMTSGKKVLMGLIAETPENLHYLRQMAETGALKAVIDRTYPLDQIADAHRHVDGGHKKGNVVVVMEG